LLTSAGSVATADRFRELRIDARLLKPIQQDELLETMYRVMREADAERPRDDGPVMAQLPPAAPATANVSLNVLVAEDNEFNAQLTEQVLRGCGHRVHLANNGREALALAQDGNFDMLLLDLHMPELDGFQVVSKVREHERTRSAHLPIIALTARSKQEDRERCLAAGMDDFLSKPVRSAELCAAIDRVMTIWPPAPDLEPPLLNPRTLWDVCGGDAGLLKKVCDDFRARVPNQLAAVHDAILSGDAPRLRETAHKLSGLLSAFSDVAGGIASKLEDHAERNDLDDVPPLLEQLEMMGRKLIEQVGSLKHEDLQQQTEATNGVERSPIIPGLIH
jgi:CheY-like chemotaxis protein/HPt (histidine-containing phosphotransfer) domain-containing protein